MRKLFLLFLLFLPISAAEAAQDVKYVALTFDDGPSGRYTQTLLEGLNQREASATFFLCGYRLEQYPELAGQILAEGHEIGLHGYSHRNMQPMSRREIAAELEKTRLLLPEDCDVRFFRPPGGCCSDGVRQVAEVTRLAIAGWSVDPMDWASRDAAAIGEQLIRQIRDGDVILMHDMSTSSVNAALAVIDDLQQAGFRFVTLSQLARIRGARIRPGRTYQAFPPTEPPE